MLRKGLYRYEYMNEWEKFTEISFPEKEEFHSKLNMEHVTCWKLQACKKSL